MDLIQKELVEVAHEWNTHRIRPNSTNPGGVPDMLYFLKVPIGLIECQVVTYKIIIDTQSYKCLVTDDDLDAAEEYSSPKPPTATGIY